MNRDEAARRALGKVIRQLRKERGLSQERLAHLSGAGRTYMGSIDRGERNPSFENLWQLIAAMGVTWGELGQALDREPVFRQPAPAPPAAKPPRRRHRAPARDDANS